MIMDKLPISDPSINLIPSYDLRKYIALAVQLSPSTPATILNIHKAYHAGRRNRIPKLSGKKDESDRNVTFTVDFTGKERFLIKQYITEKQNEETVLEDANSIAPNMISLESRSEESVGNHLKLNDIKWLFTKLNQLRKTDPSTPYLHTLLSGCRLVLPENPIQKRNPELEARCQRLRKEQEDREYHRMTKNVDSVRQHMPEETIAFQMKQINRHLIAVAQFVFSVAAGFAFGFIGIELIVGQLDFGFRLLLGIIIALVIALAEIYFLAKKLNEEYDLPPAPALVAKKTPTNVIKTIPTQGKEHYE